MTRRGRLTDLPWQGRCQAITVIVPLHQIIGSDYAEQFLAITALYQHRPPFIISAF